MVMYIMLKPYGWLLYNNKYSVEDDSWHTLTYS